MNKRRIQVIIICLFVIIILIGCYFWFIEQGKDETHARFPPYVNMAIQYHSSIWTVIIVTDAGHLNGSKISLSECAVKICPPNSSISSINWTRLVNLSEKAEDLHAVFLDELPYGIISAGDKFILDSSIYGSGSKLIVAFIPRQYYVAGIIEIY